jgi:hypothetical protein
MAETDAAEVLRAVIERAKGGDMTAAGMLMARLWPPRKGRAVTFDLPPLTRPEGLVTAFATVVRAVGSGTLTAEEGLAVGSLLELQRKAIELTELEARISNLERRNERP